MLPWISYSVFSCRRLRKVSSQKFGETEPASHDSPKCRCVAFSLITSASEGIVFAPERLSVMDSSTLTPRVVADSTLLCPVSQARVPSSGRGPQLTARFLTRAPRSAACECQGTAG